MKRILVGAVIFMLLGIGCLYFGGWKLAWGEVLWFSKNGLLSLKNDSFIFGDIGILVNFNGSYYGLVQTNRFFYSPFVSLTLLGGVSFIYFSLKDIFEEIFGEEENDQKV